MVSFDLLVFPSRDCSEISTWRGVLMNSEKQLLFLVSAQQIDTDLSMTQHRDSRKKIQQSPSIAIVTIFVNIHPAIVQIMIIQFRDSMTIGNSSILLCAQKSNADIREMRSR